MRALATAERDRVARFRSVTNIVRRTLVVDVHLSRPLLQLPKYRPAGTWPTCGCCHHWGRADSINVLYQMFAQGLCEACYALRVHAVCASCRRTHPCMHHIRILDVISLRSWTSRRCTAARATRPCAPCRPRWTPPPPPLSLALTLTSTARSLPTAPRPRTPRRCGLRWAAWCGRPACGVCTHCWTGAARHSALGA